MLGELNSSHLGFNTGGSEERKDFSFVTNETGLLFDNVNPYKVDGVIPGSNAALKEVNIRHGDLLVAVDGTPVDPERDRAQDFTSTSLAKEMRLTFRRHGKEFTTSVSTHSAGTLIK